MSGSLTHSPADIIRKLLIDEGQGTTPSDGSAWPVYFSQEPDKPDSVITVYDTVGIKNGRHQIDGEVQEHHGFLVRIRAATARAGFTKARAIAVALDESVRRDSVTVESSNYKVYSVTRISGPLSLGKDVPTSNNDLFTINAVAAIRQFA